MLIRGFSISSRATTAVGNSKSQAASPHVLDAAIANTAPWSRQSSRHGEKEEEVLLGIRQEISIGKRLSREESTKKNYNEGRALGTISNY